MEPAAQKNLANELPVALQILQGRLDGENRRMAEEWELAALKSQIMPASGTPPTTNKSTTPRSMSDNNIEKSFSPHPAAGNEDRLAFLPAMDPQVPLKDSLASPSHHQEPPRLVRRQAGHAETRTTFQQDSAHDEICSASHTEDRIFGVGEIVGPVSEASQDYQKTRSDFMIRPLTDHNYAELDNLVKQELKKHRELICGPPGSLSSAETSERMVDCWIYRANQWEISVMHDLGMGEEEIPIARTTSIADMMKRQSVIVGFIHNRQFPPPPNEYSNERRQYRSTAERNVLYIQLDVLRRWTAEWQQSLADNTHHPQSNQGGNGTESESQVPEVRTDAGKGPSTGYQHGPAVGYDHQGQCHNQQVGVNHGGFQGVHDASVLGHTRVESGPAAVYGDFYQGRALGDWANTSVPTQHFETAGIIQPSVSSARPQIAPAHIAAPAQSSGPLGPIPAQKTKGRHRKLMFDHAPPRETPLPPSALTDEDEVLDHFPEHLAHPVIMQRFVASSTTQPGGYPTVDMIQRLLQHHNARDSENITLTQRRQNIHRWIVKEKDACNKKLKAQLVPASVPASMIATTSAVQAVVQDPQIITAMAIPPPGTTAPVSTHSQPYPPYPAQFTSLVTDSATIEDWMDISFAPCAVLTTPKHMD